MNWKLSYQPTDRKLTLLWYYVKRKDMTNKRWMLFGPTGKYTHFWLRILMLRKLILPYTTEQQYYNAK